MHFGLPYKLLSFSLQFFFVTVLASVVFISWFFKPIQDLSKLFLSSYYELDTLSNVSLSLDLCTPHASSISSLLSLLYMHSADINFTGCTINWCNRLYYYYLFLIWFWLVSGSASFLYNAFLTLFNSLAAWLLLSISFSSVFLQPAKMGSWVCLLSLFLFLLSSIFVDV